MLWLRKVVVASIVAIAYCQVPAVCVTHGTRSSWSEKIVSLQANQDKDPDEDLPDAAAFARLRNPAVTIVESHTDAAPKVSADGHDLTVTFSAKLRNDSCRQIAEVHMICAMIVRSNGNEFFRSKPVIFRSFDNLRIPHVGALSPYDLLTSGVVGQYTVPTSSWRTDTTFKLVITKVVPVADETDRHDLGNFIELVANHHTSEVEQALLKDPSIIQSQDSVGTTPTLVVMAYGSPRLARCMLAHGGDIHATNTHGDNAIFYAASGNNPKMLDFVLAQGFSVNPKVGIPLKRATILNSTSSVRWLISHGADINKQDAAGYTSIASAIVWGNVQPFEILLAAKADIHCRNNQGYGLMHLAARNDGFLPKVLAAGVPVDDPAPGTKVTPLMVAAVYGSFNAAKWLLDHGANLHAKDSKGRGVFDFVRESNTLHTDQFFREAIGDLSKYGGE